MTRLQQLTYITGGFVIVSIIVLGARWSVLAHRVPLTLPASEVMTVQETPAPKTKYNPPANQKKPNKSSTRRYTKPRLVDINKASAKSLEGLPGIGAVLAKRIVAYRETHGPYSKLSDLDKVEGIGEKKFAALDGLITLTTSR